MKTPRIYLNDWLRLHPYTAVQSTDHYFVALARKLYAVCDLTETRDEFRVNICLYVAAYLEDQISGLGLWRSFIGKHKALYGTWLPFYSVGDDYEPDEVNRDDVRFIIWNALQKMPDAHPYVNPFREDILRCADALFVLVDEAYAEAPENECLDGFFSGYRTAEEADGKLTWLFGHTYLTEPAMLPYIENVSPTDRFIIPIGPLALFLHEWIELLAPEGEVWKRISGLCPTPPRIPDKVLEQNREIYRRFTEATRGETVAYLDGYDALRRFLVGVLRWPDDENHTLPHLKGDRDFVLLTSPDKGVLLAKNICRCIADPKNPLYDKDVARSEAFRLISVETVCPPDLLTYCLQNRYLPDLNLSGEGDNAWLVRNADFIARHALLYYYRGD